MRIWFKELKDNHIVEQTTVENYEDDTRTHKILHGLDEACHTLDLQVPIWLDSNIRDFKLHAKTRFGQDNFVEEIGFDYLEIEVLEEDF